MHYWLSRFRRFLLDPWVSRVSYDGLVVFAIAAVIWITFTLFSVPVYSLLVVVALPIIVAAVNQALGLYSTHTLAKLPVKMVLLITSVTLSVGIFGVFTQFSLSLILTGLFSVSALIFPRLLFNVKALTGGNSFSQALQVMYRPHFPVLVVGGGGYIGSHVVEQLLKAGHHVRVLDSFIYGQNALADLKDNPNLEIIEGDVTDIFQVTQALQDVKAVVHLAGIVGDPACSLDDNLTHHVNVVSTRLLREAVKAFKVPRFIFASSCSVYGSNEHIVNETSELNPVSLYARTKIGSEQELLGDMYDAFHPTILRFATVFGHSRRMRFDLVTNLFTAQAYYNGEITVTGGDQWRPFIHVADVARAILLALEAPIEKVSRQIFNVGDDSLNFTIENVGREVVDIVKTKKGNKTPKITVKDFVDDRRNYSVSFHKINQVLGFKAEHTLASGITEMYDHMRAGTYRKPHTDFIYSNLEMTKAVKKKFDTEEYRQKHFSVLAQA